MSRSQRIRYAAALFLTLVLAMPPALAAAPARGGGISRLCRLLIGILGKEGSSVDPDGKLAAGLRSCAKADEGSSVDPSGRKHQKADEGSSVDPNGRRTATPDAGSSVDPDGLHRTTADSGSSVDPSGRP